MIYFILPYLVCLALGAGTTFTLGPSDGKFFLSSFYGDGNRLTYYTDMAIGTHVTDPRLFNYTG